MFVRGIFVYTPVYDTSLYVTMGETDKTRISGQKYTEKSSYKTAVKCGKSHSIIWYP